MILHKILWTNGIILDVENNKEYDWLLTRNKSIYAMGNIENKPDEYDAVFDLEGKVLMSAFIKSHGCFSKEVFSYIQPDPSNCESYKDIKDTNIEENTFTDNLKKLPVPSNDDIIAAILKAQDHYFSQGITMAQEGMMTKDLIFLYKVMLANLDLDLDIVYYANDSDIETVLRAFIDKEAGYNKNLKYGGINLPLTKNSAYNNTDSIETDSKELDNFIIETSFDQELYDGLKLVSDFKISPLVTINSHSGITQFINTIEKLKRIGFDLSEYRPILITSQVLDDKQVKRIKDLNIIVSFPISDNDSTSSINSQKGALESGLLFTIHQDTKELDFSMLETIDFAVNQKSNSGQEKDKKLSVREAINAVTKNAAYQYQEEGFRGKLARGLHADFVILSDNPLKVETDKIKDIEVLKTVVRSKVVWSKY